MKGESLSAGKLPLDVLARLVARAPVLDRRVRVGPAIGVDAAVIDFGRTCLVLKSDPITFAVDRIGWYVVHVNANDIAAMGARPRWFLVTALLPEAETDQNRIDKLFDELARACRALDISLCGGHTEITPGLTRPILCGHMVGEVERHTLVLPTRIRPGDRVLLARGIAIEGTAVAARERPVAVRKALGFSVMRRARRLLDTPGISVVRPALTANEAGGVHAMHDPTEGGLAMGLLELAHAAGVGLRIRRDAVSILPETSALCRAFSLDPLRLLASGALVIVCARSAVHRLCRALEVQDIPVAEIGHVCERTKGVVIEGDGRTERIRRFSSDEIVRFLAQNVA